MINKRFLNFKTYNGFLAKKDQIPEDSIVFIQDKPCIWARGKEYICDGPSIASVERDTLTFKNGNDKTIFTLQLNGGILTIKDSNGNEISATYALKSQLSDVAFSGSYNDLTNTPDPIIVDAFLESGSEHPIENNAVYTALLKKADKTTLEGYVQASVYNAGMKGKLDKLTAGDGIDIYKDSTTKLTVIRSTLDTAVYEFVTERPDPSTANPNKIYILEINNGDGTYRYEQLRLRNGQFVSFDVVLPEFDLHDYLKAEDAAELYQEKLDTGSYLTSGDLAPYAKIEEDINPILAAFNNYASKTYVDNNIDNIEDNYATKNWVIDTFVQKEHVYYPNLDDWDPSIGESESGSSTPTVTPSQVQIIVDRNLDPDSLNPVQNSAVYQAIKALQDGKADKTKLLDYYTKTEVDSKIRTFGSNNYITGDDLATIIAQNQNVYTAGYGISIVDNKISSTLDTEAFVIVNELPAGGSPNKIYILETIDGNNRSYSQWRWDDDIRDWVPIGDVSPEINLEGYLKVSDANATYAPKGNYATQAQLSTLRSDLYDNLQWKGNYATVDYVESILSNSGYLTSSDLTTYALSQDLNNLSDSVVSNYALKQDVTDLRNFVNATYVKLAQLYTPSDILDGGGSYDIPNSSSGSSSGSSEGSSSSSGSGSTIVYNNITVDQEFSSTSPNAIANWLVKRTLDKKLERTDLADYAKIIDINGKADVSFVTDNYVDTGTLRRELNKKQDVLIEGDGIDITDGRISVTLDTNPFIVFSGDLPTTNINENKIYLLEIEVNGETKYKQWFRRNGTWVEGDVKDIGVNLDGYLTEQQADNKYLIQEGTYLTPLQASLTYQEKPEVGRFVLASEVEGLYQEAGNYATVDDLSAMRANIENIFQKKVDSVNHVTIDDLLELRQFVVDNYVHNSRLYTIKEGEHSSTNPGGSSSETPSGGSSESDPGTGTTPSGTTTIINNITLDTELSLTSPNAVQNWVIASALRGKVDTSHLATLATKDDLTTKADVTYVTNNYVDNNTLTASLNQKQDTLRAGYGIAIDNNEVSVTLDTKLFVIVEDELPLVGNSDKVYIKIDTTSNPVTYTEYRWIDNTWAEVGEKELDIDLSGYYTKEEADERYLIAGNTYLTPEQAALTYQPKRDDYVVTNDLTSAINSIADIYQLKGDFAVRSEVTAALTRLQQVIDEKYVLKADVYTPDNAGFSSSTPVTIPINNSGSSSGGSSSGGGSSKMVTLTASLYAQLVEDNLVQQDVYYFTYEGEAPSTDWHFGDNFPITFTENWAFGGTFPIILK